MTKRIIVNGQEYSSVEEMPPDVREMFGRMTRDLPDGGEHGANQAFEVEIIEGDTPGKRASGTMRTAGRSGMSSSPRTNGWRFAVPWQAGMVRGPHPGTGSDLGAHGRLRTLCPPTLSGG
jgi:hypothetical protein